MTTLLDPALGGSGGAAAPAPAPSAAGALRQAPHTAPAAGGTPRLSVVLATFRRPQLLRGCLQALLQQTLPPSAFEVIVVDDGHDEPTRALVQELAAQRAAPALRYLRSRQPAGGPAAARNIGWRAAFGDVVAFTDDDTVPAADWLERGGAALHGSVCCAMAGRLQVPVPPRPTDHERNTQGLERTEFVTANAFVRRGALLRVQGFDERFTRAWREDSDLQFRLQDEVGPVGRCEDALVVHPVRAERWGVSLRQQKNAFFEALLYAKHPRRFAAGAGSGPPWRYYAIVLLSAGALLLGLWGIWGSALVCVLLAGLLVLHFALQRLRGSSHAPAHVLEMLLTSAAIPFLSIFWRLRGALHFRTWFL